jgi:hypothetical protein
MPGRLAHDWEVLGAGYMRDAHGVPQYQVLADQAAVVLRPLLDADRVGLQRVVARRVQLPLSKWRHPQVLHIPIRTRTSAVHARCMTPQRDEMH